jgi:phosphatidate phosphatase PAH1
MHIASDMCKYGKPKEANTEVGEKNHKVFAKHIGCHCCKQHTTFAKQVSSCLSEAFIIEKMASAMGLLDELKVVESNIPKVVNGNINDECAQGTHFTIQHNGERVQAN